MDNNGTLMLMLCDLLTAHTVNTGAEPSLSVMQRSYDQFIKALNDELQIRPVSCSEPEPFRCPACAAEYGWDDEDESPEKPCSATDQHSKGDILRIHAEKNGLEVKSIKLDLDPEDFKGIPLSTGERESIGYHEALHKALAPNVVHAMDVKNHNDMLGGLPLDALGEATKRVSPLTADEIVVSGWERNLSVSETIFELHQHGYLVNRLAILQTWAQMDEDCETLSDG